MSLDTIVTVCVIQFSLLFYDYVLTLGREIEFFWKRPRRSWPFALFIANRYLIILSHVPASIYVFWYPGIDSSYSWCRPLSMFDGASIIVVQAIGGIIMIMRIYALYERDRCVLAILVFLAVGAIAVGCWAVVALPPPPAAVLVPTQEPLIGYLSAAWGGQLLFDVVIFGLTLWRSMFARMPGKRDISDILLRDVMSAANIGNIITILENIKKAAIGFTNVISATMISRLMLNLRDPTIVGSAVTSFPPLSHPSAFATTRGLPGIETTMMA
ncbi:hypothetical protein BKA83DRAFT_4369462 [Pisolithus microcarpus]|nr:hypothetical protein BKA83DRAFT_4369462 [Pisolithus microcarpus]